MEKLIYTELHPLVDDTVREAPEGPMPGKYATWRAITKINTNRVFIGVPFGARNERFDVTNKEYRAAYKTLGMEVAVQDEADWMAKGFDNVRALAALQLVQASKIFEEDILLGGNASVLLGQPDAPTLADVPAEGNIGAGATIYVYVLPLTHVGASLQNDQIDVPVLGLVTREGADGKSSSFGGFSGQISAGADVTVGGGAGHAVSASTPYITGTYSWAWYVGNAPGAANAVLYAITTINSILITEEVGTGVQTADDPLIQADNSTSDLIYDGRLSIYDGAGLEVPAPSESGAYRKVMADGVAGEGTPLTADGAGGIVEFNDAFDYFWRVMKLGPAKIYGAAGAIQDVSKLLLSGSTPVRLNVDIMDSSSMGVTGGPVVREILNKITKQKVELVTHPTMREGTYMFETLRLPVNVYPNSRVGNIHSVKLLQGYRQEEWARTTREYPSGMYHSGVYANYAPAAGGYIVNAGRA